MEYIVEPPQRNSSGSTSGPVPGREDIQRDLEERIYYPEDTPRHVRVRNLTKPDRSNVAVVDGMYHRARDAELKALRQIEADIFKGEVEPRGTITGIVSQTPCESCTEAIRNFARSYDVNGNIYHLTEPGRNLPNDPQVQRSKAAGRAYFAERKALVERRLRTGAVRPPHAVRWGDETRALLTELRALETGTASGELAPCDK